MEYRTLGKTGLKVSIVGFGGIPIENIGRKEAVEVVNRALDLGINLIHNAPTYGDSASKIGEVMKERRDECVLNVKIFGSTKEQAQAQLEQGLKMLNTERIDIVQFRITEGSFEQGMGESGGFQVLKKAQAEGTIGYIGITDHDPKFLVKAISKGFFSNLVVPFNFVYDAAQEELIPLATKMKVGITVMKPLGRGVLLNISEALNYIWGHGIPTTIVGMKSVREVEENARIGEKAKPLSKEQRERLESLAKELRQKYNVKDGALLPLGQ